jgi:hypothetical protein
LNLRPLRPERGTTVHCRAVEHGRWRFEHDSGASGSSSAVRWARVCSFFVPSPTSSAFTWAVAQRTASTPMGWLPGTLLLAGYRDGGRSTNYDRTCLISVRSFRHSGRPTSPSKTQARHTPKGASPASPRGVMPPVQDAYEPRKSGQGNAEDFPLPPGRRPELTHPACVTGIRVVVGRDRSPSTAARWERRGNRPPSGFGANGSTPVGLGWSTVVGMQRDRGGRP